MPEQVASAIVVPSGLSPAAAEECKESALQILQAAKQEAAEVSLDIDGPSPTPGAVQLVVATCRTAEHMKVNLTVLEQCESVLEALKIK